MKIFSIRAWVLLGFVISIIGILLNVPVVSEINNRIRDTETEITTIKEALRTQAAEISLADLQNDLFTIMHNISQGQSGEQKTAANGEAIMIYQSFLQRVFTAAHEIPASDVLKVENEQLGIDIKYAEKLTAAIKKKEEGNNAEFEKLFQEAEEFQKANSEPKSELGKMLREATAALDSETLLDKNKYEIVLESLPTLKTSNEKFLASFEAKEKKLKELNDRKEYLSWWSNLLTYLAISLQMFGLLCVLNKDLPIQEIKEDVSEVKEDTKEVLEEVKNSKIESQEAIDLLADLEEDLRAAIENVNKKEK